MSDDMKFVARMADLATLTDKSLISDEEFNHLIALARIGAAVRPETEQPECDPAIDNSYTGQIARLKAENASLIARLERAEADLSCFELLDVQRVARIFDISENAAEDGLEHGFLYRLLTVPPKKPASLAG